MGHKEHHAAAGRRAVHVHLVVVSTSRDEASDRSGPALREALEGCGHQIVDKTIVPDDVAAIRALLGDLVGAGAEAVVLSGGTGISARDGTLEAVQPLLDKELPGFGELFRYLSFKEIGSSAMLSRAVGGLMGQTFVFAIPGSPAACRLAVNKLIGRELAHLVRELHKELPADAEPPTTPHPPPTPPPTEPVVDEGEQGPGGWVTLEPIPDVTDEEESIQSDRGWRRRLRQLGGVMGPDRGRAAPGWIGGHPPVDNVLASAGERAQIELEGRSWTAFGFPDLLHDDAKVLLIEDRPGGEVLALHRWPVLVGLLAEGEPVLLPTAAQLETESRRVTGAPYPGDGVLVAVESRSVYARRGDLIIAWDGRRARDEGTLKQLRASLLLQWSQR